MLRTLHRIPTLRRKSVAMVDYVPNLARGPECATGRLPA